MIEPGAVKQGETMTQRRYFWVWDTWYDSYWSSEFDAASGEDPRNYTDDVKDAAIWDTEKHKWILELNADDAGIDLRYLPEDAQMRLNKQWQLDFHDS